NPRGAGGAARAACDRQGGGATPGRRRSPPTRAGRSPTSTRAAVPSSWARPPKAPDERRRPGAQPRRRRLRRGPQLAHRPGVRRGDRGRRRPGAGRPGPRAGRLALPRPRRMNGARVGITAAGRAAEQAALVRSLGGVAVLGPALRPDAPAPDDRLAPTLDRVLASPLELAVFLTGVGAELTL